MTNLPTVRPPDLPLFDAQDVQDVKEAENAILRAATALVAAHKQRTPQRPWRPSDNLTAEEVALIEAPDWMIT